MAESVNDGDMWDGRFVENELHGLGTYNHNYQRIDPATGKKGGSAGSDLP